MRRCKVVPREQQEGDRAESPGPALDREQSPSPAPDRRKREQDPLAGYQPDLVAAVKRRLDARDRPGDSEEWASFCQKIREGCGKTATEKVTGRTIDWEGDGDKTIQNRNRESLKQNK